MVVDEQDPRARGEETAGVISIMLLPGDPTPDGPFVDDDWFRFYGPDPGSMAGTTHYEVHEMGCTSASCAYRPEEPCPWHPVGCDCSCGECQVEETVA